MHEDRFHALTRTIDPHAKLMRTWPLTGGVSAQTTALEIERANGRTQKLVVRQHGGRDLQQNPRIAADEYRLLKIVRAHAIPAPTPITFDLSGDIFPTPYIVVEYVEGETLFTSSNLTDYIRQFAAQLSAIHAIDGAHPDLSFLPNQTQRAAARLAARPLNLDPAFHEPQIHAALDQGRAFPTRNRPTLLHGDFWPGNLLWQNGRLAAVIDWEDAAIGDPLADLANSRLELLWAFDGPQSEHALETFTQEYASHSPIDLTGLPAWDLYAALYRGSALTGWGLDAAAEHTMRAARSRFVAQALTALA